MQVEKRKLREEKPAQAELADLESELTQTKQEKVALVQQVDDLTQRVGVVSKDKNASEAERLKLRKTVEHLSGELKQLGGELSHRTEETQRLENELVVKLCRLEEALGHEREAAELGRLHAVAEKTCKWEEKEVRWLR